MEKIDCEIIIDLSQTKAWQRLRDLTLAHNYVPDVVRVEITTEKKEGVGASRKVFLRNNSSGMG